MIPFWVDVLGHIGYAFIAVGIILLARKSLWGWICRWIGEFIWLVIGLAIEMSSIWTWGLLFLLIDAYGFYSWRKDSKAKGLETPAA